MYFFINQHPIEYKPFFFLIISFLYMIYLKTRPRRLLIKSFLWLNLCLWPFILDKIKTFYIELLKKFLWRKLLSFEKAKLFYFFAVYITLKIVVNDKNFKQNNIIVNVYTLWPYQQSTKIKEFIFILKWLSKPIL